MPAKWAIVLMLVLLVLVGMVPFVLPIHNGRPLLDWRTLLTTEVVPAFEVPALSASTGLGQSVTVVYQWRDEGGKTHIADIPPQGQVFHILEYDSEQNIILGQGSEEELSADAMQQNPELSNAYTPAQIERLYQDAEHLVEQSEERQRLLNERITSQ